MRLFYESEDSQSKIIYGCSSKEFSSNGVEVKLRCSICDEGLFNELEDKMRRFEVLKLRTETHPNMNKFQFMIAHPYGRAKQIWVSTRPKSLKTCTCPGFVGTYVSAAQTMGVKNVVNWCSSLKVLVNCVIMSSHKGGESPNTRDGKLFVGCHTNKK